VTAIADFSAFDDSAASVAEAVSFVVAVERPGLLLDFTLAATPTS
jgi:hypothetical protein